MLKTIVNSYHQIYLQRLQDYLHKILRLVFKVGLYVRHSDPSSVESVDKIVQDSNSSLRTVTGIKAAPIEILQLFENRCFARKRNTCRLPTYELMVQQEEIILTIQFN